MAEQALVLGRPERGRSRSLRRGRPGRGRRGGCCGPDGAEDAVSGLAVRPGGPAAITVPDLLTALGPLEVPARPRRPARARRSRRGGPPCPPPSRRRSSPVVPAAVGSHWTACPRGRGTAPTASCSTRALARPGPDGPPRRAARLLDERIRAEEAAGRTVQLHLLDLAGDRVALALGDLDTADAVAVLVPGVRTTPADDLAAMAGDARDVAAAAAQPHPG